MKTIHWCWLIGCLFWVASPGDGAAAAAVPETVAADGAWTWFNDERAIVVGHTLYVGYVRRDGHVCLTAYDLNKRRGVESVLSTWTDEDDHDNPALVLLGDGRLLAAYATHGRKPFWNIRVTRRPARGTALEWEPEQTVDLSDQVLRRGVTYNNLFRLSAEPQRLYNFMRGIEWNPTLQVSDDAGRTWQKPLKIVASGDRPYVKYASNGRDRIHLAYTEGHPQFINNSIYHVSMKGGALFRTDGTPVAELGKTTPIQPGQGTLVYAYGSVHPMGGAWVWDLVLDKQEQPVLAHTVRLSPQDMRFFYATWEGAGKAWQTFEVARAGECLYPHELNYCGGMALDPQDPARLFLSTPIDPRDGRRTEHRELYEGRTRDAGRSWAWKAVTADSPHDNLRPYVVRQAGRRTCLLWFRGIYRAYTDYETEIMLRRE